MTVSVAAAVAGLLCALGWAGLDATRKALARHVAAVPLVLLLSVGQLPLFGVWAAWQGAAVSSWGGYLLPAVGSLVLNVVANLLFVVAVARSPLSVVIPLLAFVPALSALLALPMLGELPSPLQLAGIALVVAGALSLGAAAGGRGPVAMATSLLREPGSLPMLGTATAWSLTLVFDKQALAHAAPAAHGLFLAGGMSLALLLWLGARGRLGDLRQFGRARGPMVAAIVFSAVGMGAQLVAVQLMLVAVLEAGKRAIGMIASVVVGRLVFGEGVTRAKVIAVILMITGTMAIMLAPEAG